ncbi:MAG: hypothetical protein HYV90_01100 [Candidatus Woesebacteria bacterium]|nr:MAG: hypothetical protein HYV90_01100 [Candidatus Woesebacteria bacterium]
MKKLLLILLSSFLIINSLLFPFAVNAQRGGPPPTPAPSAAPSTAPTWYNQSFKDWQTKVFDTKNPSDIFGERYTAAQVQWVIYSLWSFIIYAPSQGNSETQAVITCLFASTVDVTGCMDAFAKAIAENPRPPSVAQKTDNENIFQLVFASDRPLSGISFVKEKVQNFSLVPSAHAQTVGFGFGALSPIQGAWKAIRDISFGMFVLVAIVFAFMIMFRVKLSPQTVISVQSALPKIIIALVLVTFSYAIAGFLVDLMYVVIGLISFAATSIYASTLGVPLANLDSSFYFKLMTLGQTSGIPVNLSVFGLSAVLCFIFILPFMILLIIIGAIIMAAFPPSIPVVLFILVVAIVIVFIVFIWNVLKTVWALVKAFVNILLLTIFAPIQIVAGVLIPSLGFGQWIKSYVSNLAVFVVTGTLFLFSILFIVLGIVIGFQDFGAATATIIAFFVSPVLGTQVFNAAFPVSYAAWPPLLGMGSSAAVGLLFLGVSFVLFTLTPKATEIIQGLMSGKPFAYGTAVGEAMAPVGLAYGQTAGPVLEAYRRANLEEMVRTRQKDITDLVGKIIPKKAAGK